MVVEPTPEPEEDASPSVRGKMAKPKSAATRKKRSKGRGRAKPPSLRAQSASALLHEGVVRLDGVLSPSTAASLRADILARRAAAFAAVESGGDWRQFFADVLLKTERCDRTCPAARGQIWPWPWP